MRPTRWQSKSEGHRRTTLRVVPRKLDSESRATYRASKLAAAIAVAAVVWLAVLPALGRLPAVRQHIARNNSLQIDPSAKFYSELPAMPELLRRIERSHED